MYKYWIILIFVSVLTLFSGAVQAQHDPDLVGWWALDEFFGNIATDSSGNGHHGTLHGDPNWVEGIQSAALLFDGHDDHADCGLLPSINSSGELTVTAWINPSGLNTDQKIAGNQSSRGGFKIGVYTNNKVEMEIRNFLGSPTLNRNVHGGTVLQTDTWYHVAGVYSLQGQSIKTYVDGQMDRQLSLHNVVIGAASESFKLARDPLSPGYNFSGALDDVRVYQRALADTEIAALANIAFNNDDCQYAMPIGDVEQLPFDTTQASFDGSGLCMTSPNLWYCYTSPCTGQVTVSLCGSQYDTKLAVYQGCGCAADTGALLACNDDACGLQSHLSFSAVAGGSYLIEVGGYAHRTGQGVLSIQCEGKAAGQFDLGDAPDSTNDEYASMTAYTFNGAATPAYYPTNFLGNGGTDPQGPRHLDPLLVAYLGKEVSLETESFKGPDEDGVSNIEPFKDVADLDGADDGLLEPVRMPHCQWSTLDYAVTVVDPETMFWVNVWCDWNRDGDWDDVMDPNLSPNEAPVPEWAVQNQLLFGLPAGLQPLVTPAFRSWHPDKGPDELWMRITLSDSPWTGGHSPNKLGNGGSGPEQGYGFGETEDYLILPDTSCLTCEDLNGDDLIDLNDLWILLDEWLVQCIYTESP
jgi:hypothetical protein